MSISSVTNTAGKVATPLPLPASPASQRVAPSAPTATPAAPASQAAPTGSNAAGMRRSVEQALNRSGVSTQALQAGSPPAAKAATASSTPATPEKAASGDAAQNPNEALSAFMHALLSAARGSTQAGNAVSGQSAAYGDLATGFRNVLQQLNAGGAANDPKLQALQNDFSRLVGSLQPPAGASGTTPQAGGAQPPSLQGFLQSLVTTSSRADATVIGRPVGNLVDTTG